MRNTTPLLTAAVSSLITELFREPLKIWSPAHISILSCVNEATEYIYMVPAKGKGSVNSTLRVAEDITTQLLQGFSGVCAAGFRCAQKRSLCLEIE